MSVSTQAVLAEAEMLSPSTVIEMFVIDATTIKGGIFRFCNTANAVGGDVMWQGVAYARFPVEADGFIFSSHGELPRPRVTFSNLFGAFTALNVGYQDLVRAKFIRKRTFYKFLDGRTGANPNAGYPDDIFYIHRKVSQNKFQVEYELASALEIDGLQLPARQVFSNLCSWKYRSAECSYTGNPKADRRGMPPPILPTTNRGLWLVTNTYSAGHFCYIPLEGTRNRYFTCQVNNTSGASKEPPNTLYWWEDECSKRLTDGCEIRFGKTAVLPFGGFPGSAILDQGAG